jgi:translocator protein
MNFLRNRVTGQVSQSFVSLDKGKQGDGDDEGSHFASFYPPFPLVKCLEFKLVSKGYCMNSIRASTTDSVAQSSTSDILRQIATAIAVTVTLVCNSLANALPLNNRTTGAISDTFHVYFVPAGYVFSIWGVIYLGLIAFTVYQFLPQNRTSTMLRAIAPWFLVSCAMNSGWIFLWHYGFYALSLVMMLVLLLSLVMLYIRLDIGNIAYSGASFWCLRIYLGWICVATIANATALLYYIEWNGFGISPEAWTAVLFVVGVALAVIITETRYDWLWVSVLLWAFMGIAVKHSAIPIVGASAWTAVAMTAVFLIRSVYLSWRMRSIQ